jgi:hypothetical protein
VRDVRIGLTALMIGIALSSAGQAQDSSGTATPGKACTGPEYRQFDFWLGRWEVYTPDGKRAGSNHIEPVLDGCVLRESWVGATGMIGSSYNTYAPGTRRWHQTWVDNRGLLLLLDGGFARGVMTLSGTTTDRKGVRTTHRIRWSNIGAGRDSVRQHWETSSDGGATWVDAFDGIYVRKKP